MINEIKILCPARKCGKCRRMVAQVEEATRDAEPVTMVIEDKLSEILKYPTWILPTLVINGKVIARGYVPSVEKIKEGLKAFLFLVVVMFSGCMSGSGETSEKEHSYKVTFIELGSVRCIPCQQMQPIMKSIEETYGDQVKVVFHDVWTPEGSPFADQYNIQAIPTQVFLDEKGEEYFRHQGFFPEEELVKILNQKGVK